MNSNTTRIVVFIILSLLLTACGCRSSKEKKAVEEAVSARVPKQHKDLNLKALDAGFKAGKNVLDIRKKAEEDLQIV